MEMSAFRGISKEPDSFTLMITFNDNKMQKNIENKEMPKFLYLYEQILQIKC